MVAALGALCLVGGTVWLLRVRSSKSLVVLESPTSSVRSAPSSPVVSSSTSSSRASSEMPPPLPTNDFVVPPVPAPDSSGSIDYLLGAPLVSQPGSVVQTGDNDTDGDGLTNDQESQAGTNPAVQDTDGDTLSDGDEIKRYRTDPLKTDSDGDGYTDAQEIKNGYNPLGTGKCLTSDCTF